MFFDGCKKMTALLLLSAFLPVFGDSQLRITSEKPIPSAGNFWASTSSVMVMATDWWIRVHIRLFRNLSSC